MVLRRMFALLTLVVLSASSSQSHGLPPKTNAPAPAPKKFRSNMTGVVGLPYSPYDLLEIKPFTGDAKTYEMQRDLLIAGIRANPGKFPEQDQLYITALQKSANVLMNKGMKYALVDLPLASEIFESSNYYEAFDLDFDAPVEETTRRAEEIKASLDPKTATSEITEEEKAKASDIISRVESIKNLLAHPPSRKDYNEGLKRIILNISKAQDFQVMENERSWVSRRGRFLVSFGAGNFGFMTGMYLQLWLRGFASQDPAMQWAAWEAFHDKTGLLLFGVGSELATKIRDSVNKWRRKGPKAAPPFWSMAVGATFSHYLGQAFNGKEWDGLKNTLDENYLMFKEWGVHVMRRERYKKEIADNLTIAKGNPNDPEVIKAKQELPRLRNLYWDEFNASMGQSHKIWSASGKWFSAWLAHFKSSEERQEVAISFIRMFFVTEAMKWQNNLISWTWSQWALSTKFSFLGKEVGTDNVARAVRAMSPAEQEEYFRLLQDVKYLNDLKTRYPQYFESEKYQWLAKRLATADKNRVLMIQKFYAKFIPQWINQQVDRLLDGSPIILSTPLKKVKSAMGATREFFFPDLSDLSAVEVTKGLGTRMFMGQAAMQFLFAIPSAVEFLALDEYVQHRSTDIWQGSSLQPKIIKATENLGPLANEFTYTNDPLRLSRFKDYLQHYDDVWNAYRDQVIARPLMASYQNFQKWRMEQGQKNFLEQQWIKWILKGASFDDPDFKENGKDDPNSVWHTDPVQFPHVFAEEKQHYINAVIEYGKKYHGKAEFTDDMAKEFLKHEQQTEEDFEFSNAKLMHDQIQPHLVPTFFNSKTSSWLMSHNYDFKNLPNKLAPSLEPPPANEGVTHFHNFMDREIKGVQIIGDWFKGDWSKAREVANRAVLPLPSNWQDSYAIEFEYLMDLCPTILNSMVRTPLTVKMLAVCESGSPMALLQLFQEKMFSQAAGRAQEIARALSNPETAAQVQPSWEDKADMIAVSLGEMFFKLFSSVGSLGERYLALLDQPENAEQAKAKIARENKAKKEAEVQTLVTDDPEVEDFINPGKKAPKPQQPGSPQPTKKKNP